LFSRGFADQGIGTLKNELLLGRCQGMNEIKAFNTDGVRGGMGDPVLLNADGDDVGHVIGQIQIGLSLNEQEPD